MWYKNFKKVFNWLLNAVKKLFKADLMPFKKKGNIFEIAIPSDFRSKKGNFLHIDRFAIFSYYGGKGV